MSNLDNLIYPGHVDRPDLNIPFNSVLVGGAAAEVGHVQLVLDPIIADELDDSCNATMCQGTAVCWSMPTGQPRFGPGFQHKTLDRVCSDRRSLAALSEELDCGVPALGQQERTQEQPSSWPPYDFGKATFVCRCTVR